MSAVWTGIGYALAALLILGFCVNETWSVRAREQWAARTAHSYCLAHPKSQSCDPNQHPTTTWFDRWLELAG